MLLFLQPMNTSPSLLIVCGETSSDEHTASILRYLKQADPSLPVFGMGGACLKEEGMELTVDARETASVMGLTEVIGKLSSLIRAYKTILAEVDSRKTRVALLVDFPDFNLRLAKDLKKRGITVLYFVSPQLWAWRQGRIHHIKKYVDAVFPIFPFEEDFYKEHGVDAKFSGHPFLAREHSDVNKEAFFEKFSIPKSRKLVALLPNSRKAEVEKLYPVFLDMIGLAGNREDLHYIVPVAGSVQPLFSQFGPPPSNLTLVPGHAREILLSTDAAIVASGTATVEAALCGVPFCIVYKVSALTYIVGRLLIRGVSHVGMPNLIVKRSLIKEFIQHECTPEAIFEELKRLLNDESYRASIKSGLDEVKQKLTSKDGKKFFECIGPQIILALKSNTPC
jgi:lipid-A-disaccharide synthase